MKRTEITIVGTGAMASWFAARLAQSGADVTLIGTWQAAIDTINENGMAFEDKDDLQYIAPIKAFSYKDKLPPYKHAVVLVKSWQTERAARFLRDNLEVNGVALTLQNGLGNDTILIEHLGRARVVSGTTTYGANLVSAGHVKSGGDGIVQVEKSGYADYFVNIFNNANIYSKHADNIEKLIWEKLVINSSINPLTALFMCKNGDLLSNPHSKRLLMELAIETEEVARSKGVDIDKDIVEKSILVAGKTAENISSMYQDLLRGAPTEIDAINGAIAKEANRLGVNAPINTLVTEMIKARIYLIQGISLETNESN